MVQIYNKVLAIRPTVHCKNQSGQVESLVKEYFIICHLSNDVAICTYVNYFYLYCLIHILI